MDFDPVSSLDSEWPQLVRDLLPGRLRLWAQREQALAAFSNPRFLLGFLHERTGDLDRKDAVLSALLRLARSDTYAGRFVLQAILPGLKGFTRRLLHEANEREEVWELVFLSAWEQIRTYPVERRPLRIAANLLLDTKKATLAEREHKRRTDAAADLNTEPEPSPEADVDALLRRAVSAGALSASEAELILATRIDGVSLREMAAELGVSYNAIKIRRQWAERRLLLHLGYRLDPKSRSKRRSLDARFAGAALADSVIAPLSSERDERA